jgi:hypothetical protein
MRPIGSATSNEPPDSVSSITSVPRSCKRARVRAHTLTHARSHTRTHARTGTQRASHGLSALSAVSASQERPARCESTRGACCRAPRGRPSTRRSAPHKLRFYIGA